MDTIDEIIIKTYKSVKNALIMLHNRGYLIYDKDKVNNSHELIDKELEEMLGNITTFDETYDDGMNFIFEKTDKSKVYFVLFKNITKKKDILQKITDICEDNPIHNIVCLGIEFPKNFQYELSDKFKRHIEFFIIDELKIDVIRHELVPKHILLTLEEKTKFISERKYKESELPKIFITDRICRYYGGINGDLFKILRNNMKDRNRTSGSGIYYRIVVE